MEGEIDANVPLDYIEFQISPGRNRYEVCICLDNNIEPVASGPLEQLLLHSPNIRALHLKECDAKYKLVAPEDLNGARWFTKSTLVRFLHITGLSDTLNATTAVRNEISRLEEARRFHLSLYVKGPQHHIDSKEADNSSNGDASTLKAGINSASTNDDSKNELLRAMDLRLAALRGELAAAFGQAAITRCSTEEINELVKFSSHFGAIDLRGSLCKLVEPTPEKCAVDFPHDKQSSFKNAAGNGRTSKKEENTQTSIPSNSEIPVKYGVSPAKAAQVERQSSSESGESSYSSEEEQPSVERSRTLIRSASPRRSASPMWRIQIGRSGSRRSTPLTIKSLNYFPRERLVSHKDAAEHSSSDEASEQPSKRPETNVRRMSVQDAISLFESKQRGQTVDIQKTRSLFNASTSANKSVLRRWSAGTVESSNECPQGPVSDNSGASNPDNLESSEITNGSPESKPEYGLSAKGNPGEAADVDVKPDSLEQSTPSCIQENTVPTETVGTDEKLTASAEWSRQKEAELNQLLVKMMETKPVKYRKGAPGNSKSQNLPTEQRGGFYEHYKEKRNEKLRRETAGKRTEKEKQFQAMQQILDERKAEMVSASPSDGGRKRNVRTQKSQKTLSQLANTKKDVAKPSVVRKASSKASSLPATRQSWPSTPSTRPTAILPAKTPPGTTSAGTTPTRRKSQVPPSVPKSSLKVERTQPMSKSLKATPKDTSKVARDVNEKKQQPLRKAAKPTKTKLQTNSGDPTSSGKPSLYSKVTKKSTVVPLESKPFLRKGSGIGSGVSPVSRAKVSSQLEESLRESGDLMQAEENEKVSSSSDQVIQQREVILEPSKTDVTVESESQENGQEKCEDIETPNQDALEEDASFQTMTHCKLDTEAAEESSIPPTAWVEIEEHEDLALPCNDGISEIGSSPYVAPVGMPSSRVHHSLSQMLLEESSEPDVIEWGNAENPPTMVYQKDAPKGLKRLLKFARKSKTDANSTGWSSPSVFSEGEDDAEESKSISKRSTDNLLKKATLHAKNLGHQKTSSNEKTLAANGLFAQANSKSTTQSLSEKLHEGQISASVPTTKATRSFFSLSAFKGGKQSELKFR